MRPSTVHFQRHSHLSHRQSGVVLIVVLIMLVVIGLVSASAMRGALTADQISNNARLENLAKQAAQIALSYCEAELTKVPQGITVQAASSWETYANWSTTMATTVPESYLKSNDTKAPANRPQCMAEASPIVPGGGATNPVYVVTARGFGPDYDATSNSGAVVWLQSVIAF